jgi:SAM-dependent methyltransferase
MQYTEEQLKEIASQLACPNGEEGLKTAKLMNTNNAGMISNTISALNLADHEVILEIGPGNGAHVYDLLTKAEHLQYFGIDISTTMIAEAKQINKMAIDNFKANFYHAHGNELPFPTLRFDKAFTVNTIYFWTNPLNYTKEIKRVLKPGGLLTIGFADKDFMKNLPFTPYGFNLYSKADVAKLLTNAGFTFLKAEEKTEQIETLKGEFVTRNYWVVTAQAD